MSLHFFVRFEPKPGTTAEFREELLRVVEAARTEAGCLAIHAFETPGEPNVFAIHSEWVDDAAFEHHAGLPHTVRFLQAASELLTHPIQGLRTHEIVRGAGAGVGATAALRHPRD